MTAFRKYSFTAGAALALLGVYAAQALNFEFLREGLGNFALFICFYLVLPTFALSRFLFRDSSWGPETSFVLAYPVVLSAHVVMGVVISAMREPRLVFLLPAIAVGALLWRCGKRPDESEDIPPLLLAIAIAEYILLIGLMWLTMWAINAPPAADHPVQTIYQDHLWNVGNIWSIIHGGWPPADPRALGEPLSYHLAQSLVHATGYWATGIHPFYLQDFLFPPFDLLVLALVIAVVSRTVGGLSVKTVIWLSVTLLFAKGLYWYYHGHIYLNPLTFFYSLAPLTILVFVLKASFEQRIRLPVFYIGALYLLLIATKMPLALIILPALAAAMIFQLAQNRRMMAPAELLLGVLLVAETFLVKAVFFSGDQRGVMIGTAIPESRVYQMLVNSARFLPESVSEFIFGIYVMTTRVPLLFVSAAGAVILVFAWAYFHAKAKPQKHAGLAPWIAFVLAMIVASSICRYFLQYEEYASGASIYFEWYPMWLLPLLAAALLTLSNDRKVWNTAVAAAIAGVCFQLYAWVPGIQSIRTETSRDMRQTLDLGEWQAMHWINKNTSPNAVIASDRRAFRGNGRSRDQSRFFYYSALGGRQMLMEGEDFIGGNTRVRLQNEWGKFDSLISNGNPAAVAAYLSETPAHYFIQSLRFDKLDLRGLAGLSLEYENNSVRIFQIKRPN